MEIIEPNPLLIKYVQRCNSLFTEFDSLKKDFVDSNEWHYIMSNLEQNIFLLQRLKEKNLLNKNTINICDAGIGLGAALFDIYLQSQEITDKKFYFTGIEKYDSYLNYLNEYLIENWKNKLTIIKGDIMQQDYSKYDIVYSYSPFRSPRLLVDFYTKVKNEISPGSLIIENRNKGYGIESTMTMVDGLECIVLDDIVVFKKTI
jgi:hypothetical protein